MIRLLNGIFESNNAMYQDKHTHGHESSADGKSIVKQNSNVNDKLFINSMYKKTYIVYYIRVYYNILTSSSNRIRLYPLTELFSGEYVGQNLVTLTFILQLVLDFSRLSI